MDAGNLPSDISDKGVGAFLKYISSLRNGVDIDRVLYPKMEIAHASMAQLYRCIKSLGMVLHDFQTLVIIAWSFFCTYD